MGVPVADPVAPGTTSYSIYLRGLDPQGQPVTNLQFDTPGLSLVSYRLGGTVDALPLNALPNVSLPWSSGGFVHVHQGIYRYDLPDAQLVAGARDVLISGTATDTVFIPLLIPLRKPFDPNDQIPATPPAQSYDDVFRQAEDGTLKVDEVTNNVGGKVLGGGAASLTGIGVRSDLRQWIGNPPLGLVSQLVQSRANIVHTDAITSASYADDAIQAAAIQDGALNGKGNWNIGKTGYALSGTQTYNNTGQTDTLPANTLEIDGQSRPAQTLALSANTISTVVCGPGGDENTIVYLSIDPDPGVDKLKGQILSFDYITTTGALATAKARVTGGNGTDTLTLDNSQGDALPVAPVLGDTCVIG